MLKTSKCIDSVVGFYEEVVVNYILMINKGGANLSGVQV